MKKALLSVAFVFATFISAEAQDPVACDQVTVGNISNGGFLGGDTDQILAVDIPVYAGTSFTVNTIKVNLIDSATYINIVIREDNDGVPGAVLDTYNNVNITGSVIVGNNFNYDFYQNTIDVSSEGIS